MSVNEKAAEIIGRLCALPVQNVPNLRALRWEYSKQLAKSSPRTILDLAFRLLDDPRLEFRFIAFELVCHHRGALARVGPKELLRLSRGLASWGDVDAFACYLSGPVWREGQVSDKLIHQWAASPDRWLRRTALVSTVPLNNKARGGQGNAVRTLEVCRALVKDRDDMVVKALSWALRELAKRDPGAVRTFLKENKSVLAARVLREVRNKLTTGLKNPRGRA